MGRKSIYLVSFLIWTTSTGLMMVYFIVFGDIFASISLQLFFKGEENFLTTRACWVLCLGVGLTPLVIKKHLKELKVISFILFGTLALFIFLFFLQMILIGLRYNEDTSYSQYWRTTWDTNIISAFSTVLVAFTFQANLFPLFNSMAGTIDQKNSKVMAAVGLALLVTVCIYIVVGITCVYDFGDMLSSNVLDNVDEETGAPISYIIRVSFLLVLACHIPYIFFTGKESTIIVVVETWDKTMSAALESLKMQEDMGGFQAASSIKSSMLAPGSHNNSKIGDETSQPPTPSSKIKNSLL
jgi:amino acid permease